MKIDYTHCFYTDQYSRVRQLFVRAFTLSLVLVLGGCLSFLNKQAADPVNQKQVTKTEILDIKIETAVKVITPPVDLWERLRKGLQLGNINNSRIDHEIKRLQKSSHSFNQLIKRTEPFLFHIVEAIEERSLPAELALLPAVESGYKPFAYSQDGAAGLWQFMPSTGKMLGLNQNWWADERRGVIASTEAALEYLEKLNKRAVDNDWLHTLAAYNAGASTVRRAVRKATKKGTSISFWDLDLPGETDSYVPRLLALAKIIDDPDRYGMALASVKNQAYFEAVSSQGQIDLKIAADLAGIPAEDLLQLNPEFNRWTTTPKGSHKLLFPIGAVDTFKSALAKLPPNKRIRWIDHKIMKGDVIGRLAKKYKVSIAAIKQSNHLKNNNIRLGKVLRIPLSDAITGSASRKLGINRSKIRYQVKQGDSLYKISRKFNVKIADLKRWNKLGRYLKPGQRLTLFLRPSFG